MHTFETPGPISVDLKIEFGGARIIAREGTTTVVDVHPVTAGRRADVEAAERTRVVFAGDRLEVRAPHSGGLTRFLRPGAIEVLVQLPSGSHVSGSTSYGDLEAEGRLGECFLKTSYGSLRVDEVATLTLQTSAGDITARRVTGLAEMSSSSGDLRIAEAGGVANLKTSSGDVRVERASDGINARTAYGAIRVAHAVRGELTLVTSYGDVEVGVGSDTATFLELRAQHGAVRNELERAEGAPERGESLRVKAQTGYGDIRIRRA